MPGPRCWREIPQRYRLEAGRCRACGHVAFPGRHICPSCRSADCEKLRLTRRGTVVTSTVIHVSPSEFTFETPYAMAVVETPEKAITFETPYAMAVGETPEKARLMAA